MTKDNMDIKIKHKSEFSSKLEVEGNTYLIQTEDMGAKICQIITRTYLNGAIINASTTNYSHLGAGDDIGKKVHELMESQHKSIISSFSKKEAEQVKSKAEFSKEMMVFLKKGKKNTALDTVRQALGVYPSDPYFLSYFGFLIAAVEKKAKEGYKICQDAIRAMNVSNSEDKNFFYPLMYHNLGRAYLLGKKKKDAFDAFKKGLKYDPRHKELLSEIQAIGVRRPPVLSFLDRSNPINKYLGKIRHKLTSK